MCGKNALEVEYNDDGVMAVAEMLARCNALTNKIRLPALDEAALRKLIVMKCGCDLSRRGKGKVKCVGRKRLE